MFMAHTLITANTTRLLTDHIQLANCDDLLYA